ncbi:hypothetical protein M405DRAFT_813471 [Rhizopogon salebrosus TDB-379]|nr:hypothetical protein M405DRAFT_813471 [Rhizopogon salebrosus TDB-379]
MSEASSVSFTDVVRLVIGPAQVCGLLSAALFGCLAVQCYLYFTKFTNDHLVLKATVATVFLIQLGHFACIILTLWTMTVSTYGDPSQLIVLPLGANLAMLVAGFTVFIVQSFYAFRLWKLSRKVFLPILCESISVVAQTSTTILMARAFDTSELMSSGDVQKRLLILTLVSRAVCDLTTTAGIAWSLQQGRDSGIKDTITLINRLMLWTIETGLATSLMAVTVATLFLSMKQNYIWIGALLIWPNVVGNSLLASLNHRLVLRENTSKGGSRDRGVSLSRIVIRVDATSTQTQPSPMESFKNRGVHVLEEEDRSTTQGRTGSHASMCSTDDEGR